MEDYLLQKGRRLRRIQDNRYKEFKGEKGKLFLEKLSSLLSKERHIDQCIKTNSKDCLERKLHMESVPRSLILNNKALSYEKSILNLRDYDELPKEEDEYRDLVKTLNSIKGCDTGEVLDGFCAYTNDKNYVLISKKLVDKYDAESLNDLENLVNTEHEIVMRIKYSSDGGKNIMFVYERPIEKKVDLIRKDNKPTLLTHNLYSSSGNALEDVYPDDYNTGRIEKFLENFEDIKKENNIGYEIRKKPKY